MKNDGMNEIFFTHNAAVREQALDEFRRRNSRRRIANASAVVCALGFILAFVFVRPGSESNLASSGSSKGTGSARTVVTQRKTVSENQVTMAGPSPDRIGELSDEQLLAIFPEGSCFLAEVNGRKTLVFHDPAVRARFFN
jgi:hypothetical protein